MKKLDALVQKTKDKLKAKHPKLTEAQLSAIVDVFLTRMDKG